METRARTLAGTAAPAPRSPLGSWRMGVATRWIAPLLVALASAIAVFGVESERTLLALKAYADTLPIAE